MAGASSSSSSSTTGGLKPGTIVHLHELCPSSPFLAPSASVRVMGTLQTYDLDSGIAVISEGSARLRVATHLLRDLHYRTGSLFQFIGELVVPPGSSNEEILLQARVGRNVDGLDVKLYNKALELRRQFEAKHLRDLQR